MASKCQICKRNPREVACQPFGPDDDKTAFNDDYAKIRFGSGKLHAVYAAGSASDGSLYGFRTLCGKRILDPIDDWHEEPRSTEIECGTCKRVAQSW